MGFHIDTGAFRVGVMTTEAGRHAYSLDDIRQRFDRCVGRTLGEIDSSNVFVRYAGKNKGIAGDVVEQSVLGYPADSRQEPDLEVDGMDVELKVTGLKHNARGDVVAKEPMSITAVSIDNIWSEEFETSTLWHKLEHLLVFYYLYEPRTTVEYDTADSGWKTVSTATSQYASFPVMGWDLHEWTDEYRETLRTDWQIVRDYVRKVREENPDEEERKALWPLISTKLNPQMMYLGTAPKYPNPPRFRLKNSVVTTMWKMAEGKSYERLPDEPSSFAELDARCRQITSEYAGRSVEEIANMVGYEGEVSKSISESVVVRMFGGISKKMSRVELFAMAGVSCKTIVLTSRGMRTEDMKLFRVDLDEVQDPDLAWEDSSFAAYFCERQLLCPVFQEPRDGCSFGENVFRGFKRMAFPDGFIDTEAKRVWERMRHLVFAEELVDVISCDADGNPRINRKGNIVSAPNWPKSRDGIVFIRGGGGDSDDKTEVVNGVRMYRQSAWVKGSWMVNQLATIDYL